jgi:hypothetical protein
MESETRERLQSLRRGIPATAICALSLLIGAAGVHAQEMAVDRFTIRGFGTAGATTHDAEGVQFRRNVGQGEGAEEGDIDFNVDSLAGLQLDFELGSKVDVMLQGVSRLAADGSWGARMSQGFIRYSPDESLVMRVGRVGYDIYLLAESRQVGYSYLTVRPSPEFYGQITDDDIDGADISYTRRLGPGLVRARVFGGSGSGELGFADGTHRGSKSDIYGSTLDYIYRGWTGRVAFVQFNYHPGEPLRQLAGALRSTGSASAIAVADDLTQNSMKALGVQVGVAYEEGPMLAQFMYGAGNADSLTGPNFDKSYALLGYRWRKWTPFLAHAGSYDREPIHDAGLPAIPMLQPLNAAVEAVQVATRSTQHTTSIGVRYDVSSRVDFKLQFDRTQVRESALNFDYRPPTGTGSARPFDMNVIAATVDFVF